MIDVRQLIVEDAHQVLIHVLVDVLQIRFARVGGIPLGQRPVLDDGIQKSSSRRAVCGLALLGGILDVHEPAILPHGTAGAVTDLLRDLLRVEQKVLKSHDQAVKLDIQILVVEVVPVMQDGFVVSFELRVLDPRIENSVIEVGTILAAVSPVGCVLVLAHAAQPRQWVSDGHGWKDVGGIDVLVFGGLVLLSKLLVTRRRVFAPRNLPSNAAIDGTVLLHAIRHVTIANEEFRHEVGARVECSSRADEMVGPVGVILEGLAAIQSVDDGLVAVQSNNFFPCRQFVVELLVVYRIDVDASLG
mmetsp:Transcript_8992/g.24315  ORF Transcript_8992/g.24315 Transcript_8992/m.24315 type:complete len:302 (-) Transcript_8992:660-1565(-)